MEKPAPPLESYRPHYHLTPVQGWINDPNGLCYFRGQWHAFYQHYDPTVVNSMQWGHAVSSDLVHWRRLPDAIGPDAHGQPWSGSAVIDHHDTTGLCAGQPGLVCVFTYWDKSDSRQCQGLAYSTDGITFQKYPGNPVIPQLRYLPSHPDDKDFRDPKVFWHAPTHRWIMAVAGGILRIFSSPDLIHWQFESADESLVTECPDLFPMHIDGDPDRPTWVLSGGGRWYMFGDFDGFRFLPHSPRIDFTQSPDFYAAQTFNDAPDHRRIALSWLYAWRYGVKHTAEGIIHPMPTAAWSGGSLTVPHELQLRTTPMGPRLMISPARELADLRMLLLELHDSALTPASNLLGDVREAALDIELECECPADSTITLRISASAGSYYLLGYDGSQKQLFVDRRNSGLKISNFSERISTGFSPAGPISLRILLDHNCVELFAADGSAALPAVLFPDPDRPALQLSADGGDCRIKRLAVYRMPPAIV